MSKPKKKKKQTVENVETLTSDEVMRHVFGVKGGQVLKEQLLTDDLPDEPEPPPTHKGR